MCHLQTVYDRTYIILTDYPKSRNDDDILVYHYMLNFHGITTYFESIGRLDIPKIKSMERCRRLIQMKYPELRPDEEIANTRRKLEGEYQIFNNVKRNSIEKPMKIMKTKELRQIETKWKKEYLDD